MSGKGIAGREGETMANDTVMVSFRCPPGLLSRIEYQAQQENRTRTQIILKAMREYLLIRQSENQIIVDSGGTIKEVFDE
jgi:hypothetical protein